MQQEITMEQIAPYVRYVNDITFAAGVPHLRRVIYDHEFIYILSGTGEVFYGGQSYPVEKGSLFYIKPGIQNQMFVHTKMHAHCVHFDWVVPSEENNFRAEDIYLGQSTPAMLEAARLRPYAALAAPWLPCHTAGLEQAAGLFREAYRSYSTPGGAALLQGRAALLQIIAALYNHHVSDGGMQHSHPHRATVEAAAAYLREHYAEGPTAALLARRFGLSPKYFGVLFKQLTGKPVHEYLLDIRLFHAKRLLRETDLPLERIAEVIGFQDEFYFNRCFKKVEGAAPGKYRRMLRL